MSYKHIKNADNKGWFSLIRLKNFIDHFILLFRNKQGLKRIYKKNSPVVLMKKIFKSIDPQSDKRFNLIKSKWQ